LFYGSAMRLCGAVGYRLHIGGNLMEEEVSQNCLVIINDHQSDYSR